MGNGMNKILPGLYVGNFRDSRDEEQLKNNKITHILSIHDNAKATRSDIIYLCLDAKDAPSQDLTQYFSQCNDFIHSARIYGGNVLVHCLAGVSRSVTLTIAYIMSVTNLGWRDSLNVVRASRTCAGPNFGFQKQLVAFQHEGVSAEKTRLLAKYPTTKLQASDRDECKQFLEKHERWVIEGDQVAVSKLDEMIYPLPHDAYSEKSANSGTQNETSSVNLGPSETAEGSGAVDIAVDDVGSAGRVRKKDVSAIGDVIFNVDSGSPEAKSDDNGLGNASRTAFERSTGPALTNSVKDVNVVPKETVGDVTPQTSNQEAIDNLFTQGRNDNNAKY